MKTLKEHLQALLDTRDAKRDEMKKLTEKTIEENRTMDGAEAEQFEKLRGEIKKLDDEIVRLKEVQEMDAKTAAPVETDTKSAPQSSVPYSGSISAKPKEKLEPGIAFARAAKCLALGFLEHRNPIDIAGEKYGHQNEAVKTVAVLTKANISPNSTGGGTGGSALVHDAGVAGFLEYLRPFTIVGRFGRDGIPDLKRVPFRAPVIVQTRGATAYWVPESGGTRDAQPMKGRKPLTPMLQWTSLKLEPFKIATISVATMELIRDSSMDVDRLIRDELARAVIAKMDESFIDPALAPATGENPGSILNGITATASSGGVDADAVRADINALVGKFLGARNYLRDAVFIMGSKTAYSLAMMYTLGNADFPDISMRGGKLAGIPVIVSDYVPADVVALVSANDILYADEGDVELSMSTEASLQMVSTATEDPQFVSMWQNNLVAFRAERRVSWQRSPRECVEYLTGVNWGQATP